MPKLIIQKSFCTPLKSCGLAEDELFRAMLIDVWTSVWQQKYDTDGNATENCESRWRHQMETFSALLAICTENSLVTGEFSSQMPLKRSFDVFFYLRLNKPLGKQWRRQWFETPSHSLWRHCNVLQDAVCLNDTYTRFMCDIIVFSWVRVIYLPILVTVTLQAPDHLCDRSGVTRTFIR